MECPMMVDSFMPVESEGGFAGCVTLACMGITTCVLMRTVPVYAMTLTLSSADIMANQKLKGEQRSVGMA